MQQVACAAGVRRGGKGGRRASEAGEDRTRDDRGRGPSPSRAHFDFLPFLSTPYHASYATGAKAGKQVIITERGKCATGAKRGKTSNHY